MFKIIKNGKLFGVLNVLDIVIIILVLAIALPAIHYYIKFNEKGIADQRLLERTLGKAQNGVKESICTLDVYASFKNLTKDGLTKLKVGDKETLPDGTILCEILRLDKPQSNYFVTNLGIGAVADERLYSMPAKLRLRGVVRQQVFIYKMRNMADGSLFKFNDDFDFVIELHFGQRTGIIDVYASFKNLTKDTLNKIKVGDREVLLDGTVLCEVLWLGKPQPNYFITNIAKPNKERIRAVTNDGLYALPAKLRLRGIVEGEEFFKYRMRNVDTFSTLRFNPGNYDADCIIETDLFEEYEKKIAE